MWKLRSDPWRKVVWARGTPKETWDSPELSWVRGSDAIKCLLRCWAPGSGSGQYQVTTKLPLRHWHSMPQVAHNSRRKKTEESKTKPRLRALNANDHTPRILWSVLGYSLRIPEPTIFPFWATLEITSQKPILIICETSPKMEEIMRRAGIQIIWTKFPIYCL